MSTMNQRLKHARIQAGFRSATAAIEHCGWNASTYRAHENGQNNYKIKDAKIYAEAYDVSPVWLLVGENNAEQNKPKVRHKHNCVENIFAAALLLRDDPNNAQLLKKIQACISSQLAKIS
jgi:DNA-binding XRE family transcriptional regulator